VNGSWDQRRALVTGASGMLGTALIGSLLARRATVGGLCFTHPITSTSVESLQLDLADREKIKPVISAWRPSVIIHAAALTDPERCEREPELAEAINVKATRSLAEAAEECEAKFVYISTEAVYGEAKNPHKEEDVCEPLSEYARTKLAGEYAAQIAGLPALILRTTIFGLGPWGYRSLLNWILESLLEKKEIPGFDDVEFSPLSTLDFADITLTSIEAHLSGTFNAGAKDACSKYEFARLVSDAFHLDGGLILRRHLQDGPLRGKRSRNAVLDSSSIERQLKQRLPSVRETLELFAKGVNLRDFSKEHRCTS
jgi:dTDP-4-dehydrorhamnose reductase